MGRYVITILFVAFVVGIFILADTNTNENGNIDSMGSLGTIGWSIIGIASFFTFLSVWGLVGVGFSKLKEKSRELSLKEAVISKRSWHYRLNTWANFSEEPRNNISECEYWARLFHGLCGGTPIVAIAYIFVTIFALLIWLVGARVSSPFVYFKNSGETDVPFFNSGNQPFGPLVTLLLVAGSIASILLLSDFWQSLLQAPWESTGKWAGMVIGSVAGGIVSLIVVFLIGRWIWHSILQPFLSFANARAVGLCRKTRFIE